MREAVLLGVSSSLSLKKSEHPREVHGAGNLQVVLVNLIINSALGRDLSVCHSRQDRHGQVMYHLPARCCPRQCHVISRWEFFTNRIYIFCWHFVCLFVALGFQEDQNQTVLRQSHEMFLFAAGQCIQFLSKVLDLGITDCYKYAV